jgi:trans-aconitate methyltransferase
LDSQHKSWSPAEYAHNNDMQWRQAIEAISRLEIPPEASILDVGSGDGRVSAELSRRVAKGSIVGIDLNAAMVEYANTTISATTPNLSFSVCGADELVDHPELWNRFDLVTSFSTLHWVRDRSAVWNGFRKALRGADGPFESIGGSTVQGGPVRVLAAFQVDHPDLWPIVGSMLGGEEWSARFEKFSDPYNHWNIGQVTKPAREAGFDPVRTDEITCVEWFPSMESLRSFLVSWVPAFKHLESVPEAQQSFVDAVMDHLRSALPARPDSSAGLRMRRIIVEAELI